MSKKETDGRDFVASHCCPPCEASVHPIIHTPGPWHQHAPNVSGEVDDTYRSIRGGSGCLNIDGGFELTGFIREADARLMKESPEMLKVIEIIANATGDTDLECAQELSQEILMRLKVV